MKVKIAVFFLSLVLGSTNVNGQTFQEFLKKLPEQSIPKKFRGGSKDAHPKLDLPASIFNDPVFDLTLNKAYLKLELDSDFPIVIIGRLRSPSDNYFISATAYSFDKEGRFIDYLHISHSADGEGSQFSITPEYMLRVASYGSSLGVINTYRFEEGFFLKENTERIDADELPEY